MILTYAQREAIRHLAHNLTAPTLAAIVADLSDSNDPSLISTSVICEASGIGDCGEEEFTEMVAAALETSGPVYYTGYER